ncbi:MAG: hypothetical protein Q4A15_10785, partial [Prevotellaceae bacterium]|nr:hypothetical protein [Prevotellaceae bacterium]
MLQLTIPETELWDEKNEMFVYVKEHTLQLEHSLVSLSKWESKWKKPFIGSQKSDEETIDYIRCMTITQHVDPNVYRCLRQKDYAEINDYISDPYTATTFPKSEKNGRNSEIVTSELIYFWMISFGIPFECQKWNLNKLFALIK